MSAGGSSWTSYNVRSLLQLINRYRSNSTNYASVRYTSAGSLLPNKIEHGYQGLHLIRAHDDSTPTICRNNLDTNMVKVNDNKVKPPPPPTPEPPRPNFPAWAKWVLGTILSIILPFWSQKWLALKKIEAEVEIGLKEAENVAAVVEKAAMEAENVSSQVAEKLPDNGKLKEAAVLIQDVSKATAHDAHLTNSLIHKVDDLVHDVEDLETMVEPVIEKLLNQKSATEVK